MPPSTSGCSASSPSPSCRPRRLRSRSWPWTRRFRCAWKMTYARRRSRGRRPRCSWRGSSVVRSASSCPRSHGSASSLPRFSSAPQSWKACCHTTDGRSQLRSSDITALQDRQGDGEQQRNEAERLDTGVECVYDGQVVRAEAEAAVRSPGRDEPLVATVQQRVESRLQQVMAYVAVSKAADDALADDEITDGHTESGDRVPQQECERGADPGHEHHDESGTAGERPGLLREVRLGRGLAQHCCDRAMCRRNETRDP